MPIQGIDGVDADTQPLAPPLISNDVAIAPATTAAPTGGGGVALTANGLLPPSAAATGLRMVAADPVGPLIGEFWYRTDLDKLSVQTITGVKRSAAYT